MFDYNYGGEKQIYAWGGGLSSRDLASLVINLDLVSIVKVLPLCH